jgi:hypothetical protein
MGDPGENENRRNREIARNEENRKTFGAIRVSTWAIVVAATLAALVIAMVWRG